MYCYSFFFLNYSILRIFKLVFVVLNFFGVCVCLFGYQEIGMKVKRKKNEKNKK